MHFTNLKNFSITGQAGSVIKYAAGLRFGAFSPTTGEVYDHGNGYFVNSAYVAVIGYCISLENCENVTISGITLDGNSSNLVLGGIYGDVGRQVPHTGIFILNSRKINIDKAYIHHFGLDGITISNKENTLPDNLTLSNSTLEYNSRQGLSWVGGNMLNVKNCKFNHTGKAKFYSPPGAGVDIEGEVGPIRNGSFEDCEFVDNSGCGFVADSGNSGDCTLTGCTFWGTTSWSSWVTKPGFSFQKCNIYGSFAHGYSAASAKDATTFNGCTFEDKPYNGNPPYGKFLVETNGIKRMSFNNCTFISNVKKLGWFSSPAVAVEEKYQFVNCSFVINNKNLPASDFAGVIRGAALKNCTFTFGDPDAKRKRIYVGGYAEPSNADLGGNKVLYKDQ
jgi:hypothetical protein